MAKKNKTKKTEEEIDEEDQSKLQEKEESPSESKEESSQDEDGKDNYPFVYIKDFDSISPLPTPKNTCTFDVDEEETQETEIKG